MKRIKSKQSPKKKYPPSKPVIFLDIDGVLNSTTFHKDSFDRQNSLIDPILVARLDKLVQKTDSLIVISSALRFIYSLPELREILGNAGIKNSRTRVIDTLLGDSGGNRLVNSKGTYILDWLRFHPKVKDYLILDDTDLTDDIIHSKSVIAHFKQRLFPNLVRTDPDLGLTEENDLQAAKILSHNKIVKVNISTTKTSTKGNYT